MRIFLFPNNRIFYTHLRAKRKTLPLFEKAFLIRWSGWWMHMIFVSLTTVDHDKQTVTEWTITKVEI